MKISVFHDFEEIKYVWKEFEKNAACYGFQTFDWISYWHEIVGDPVLKISPCLVLLYDSEEHLRMLLPLGIRNAWGLKILEWIGGLHADYMLPLIDKSFKIDANHWNQLWKEICAELPPHDVIHLQKQPEWIEGYKNPFCQWNAQVHSMSYEASLKGSWEDYYKKQIKTKIRADSRRQCRRLGEQGTLDFQIASTPEEIELWTQKMIDLKRFRYCSTEVWDMLSVSEHRQFYHKMSEDFISQAFIHLAVLKLDDEVLAAHWGMVYEDRFYYLMPAFEGKKWKRYSAGRLLLEHLLEWSFDQGLKVFDFTIGGEEYKKDWCDQEMRLYEHLNAVTIKGQPYVQLRKFKERIKGNPYLYEKVRRIKKSISSLKHVFSRKKTKTPPLSLAKLPQLHPLIKPLLRNAFYAIGGLSFVQKRVAPWRGSAAIFCYHRVIPDKVFFADQSPNANLAISVTAFEEQLSYLQQNYRIISIQDLETHLESDSEELVLVITLDDGYKDNLEYALPILKKLNVPATIYVSTRFPEGETQMWWYEVWELITEQEIISIQWSGELHTWKLLNKEGRLQCFNKIRSLILKESSQSVEDFMGLLRDGKPVRIYPEKVLTWEEIEQLDKEPLITIGAHTHTHPNLKNLSRSEAEKEMRSSKVLLEEHLKHPVLHFAYPYGTRNEAVEREYELAEQCGFATAVTTNRHALCKEQRFDLPRYGITIKMTPSRLSTQLSGWNNLFGR